MNASFRCVVAGALVATVATVATACDSFGTEPPAAMQDAGADVGKALGPFCSQAGAVTFCDEFDRLEPLGGGWTTRKVIPGASLAILAEGGREVCRQRCPPLPARASRAWKSW